MATAGLSPLSEQTENDAFAQAVRPDAERRADCQFLQHFEPTQMEGGDDAEVSELDGQAGRGPPRGPVGLDDTAGRGETDQRRFGGAQVAGTREHDFALLHQEVDADQAGRSRVRSAYHLQTTAST